jgi:ABC-type amino acid transport system permease subunit
MFLIEKSFEVVATAVAAALIVVVIALIVVVVVAAARRVDIQVVRGFEEAYNFDGWRL